MIEFIGKFHPLLVHLPIGFLVLLGLFELPALCSQKPQLTEASRFVLFFTVPVTLASIASGWLLAGHGEYAGSTVFWHRWLGTALGAATLLLLGLHWCGLFRLYRWGLIGTLALLIAASHLGGTLTHGTDFLSWPRAKFSAANPAAGGNLADGPVYATAIQPVFDKYCVNCHGPDKAKGGLRLDTRDHFLKGGDDGSLIEQPGAAHSLLGQRLALPLDDDDHMPPDGKPQPSPAQLAVINWWLDAGAPLDKTIQELKPAPEILRTIETTAGAPVSDPAHEK